jgi:exosome complex RNA-binding protein Rrp42 (RNase PH superfamily)
MKVKYDLQNDTGDVWLDDTPVFSQVALGTTSSHYFEPAVTFEGGNDCHTRVWVDDVYVYADKMEDSTLTVTSPNGGEHWEAGSTENITWSSTGYIDYVNIEFSADGGVSWEEIAASIPNEGIREWTVPETLSENCLIRIGDMDGTPADVSDGVFSIVEASSVTVTSPNGGESLEVGSSHNITWNTTGMIASIKIQYSIDNGSSWKDIAMSTANNGYCNWNVPDSPSDNCLVRISDHDGEGNASDVSDAVFSIVPASNPTITVISPNGGESWDIGTAHNISWRSTGTVNKVKIEYSPDKGSTWRQIVISTPNDGGFSWQVPAQPSETCLVRISETDGEPADISDAVFTIAAAPRAAITVTSPNGGENLAVGENHEITWTSTGKLGDVTIEYSTDRGNSWKPVAVSTTNDGSYDWTVPNSPSTQCLLRISEIGQDQGASDVSDSGFSIVSPTTPSLTITSPNGGETLTVGSSHPIAWTSTGTIGSIKIECSTDGGNSWEQIIASMTNEGLYNWTVADKPSGNCLIRIGETDGEPSDISDGEFSILPPPSITVISPNGGENWEVFSSRDITWTSSGTIDKVKIEYSTDMGTFWTTIVTCIDNSGSYTWTIPDTPSNQCRIRISDCSTDEGPSDTSDSEFSIVLSTTPTLVVTFPNGGEKLTVGSLHEITWTSTGTIGNIKIEYSMDGGNSWAEIIASMANDGSYDWEVPDTPSENCLIRVSETDGEPVDVTDTAFSIVSPSTASITVIAPNGGETLAAGSSYTITWTSTGSIENVIIEYSNDEGASWRDIVTAAINDGSYEWIVPDDSSVNCLVRISGSDLDSEPTDVSDTVFEITTEPVSSITVTAPNGGEGLMIDSTYEITWHSTDTINLVDIEYSKDNGSNWIIIAVSFPNNNNGSYNWTVPNTPSDKCLIRVRANDSDKGPWDVSDATFSIIPGQI